MADRPTPDERRFRALARSSVDHITEIDAHWNVVYASPDPRPGHDATSLGLDRIHPEDRERVTAKLAQAFSSDTSQSATFRVFELCGEMRWLETTLTPFTAENDERHALIVSRDVTESRRMEQNHRETRERFRRVAENGFDMIAEHDAAGRLLYCNHRVWQVLGFDGVEHRGIAPSDLLHPDDRERVAKAFGRVRDGVEESLQLVHRIARADGSWCWAESTTCASEQRGGERHFLVIARDVSGRVEAELRVRESELRYRELVENAPVGIAVVRDDEVVFANTTAAGLCGAESAEQLIGTNMYEMLPASAMEEVAHAVGSAERGEAQTGSFNLRLLGIDGQKRHLLGVGTYTTYGGEPAFQAIMRDVTELERSQRDQERLTLQLQESRKLESLGVLAGGIAHDFNNLLAVILSNVRYAKTPTATPHDRTEALTDAENATESAARLVRQLLDYAGRRKPEVRSVDLSQLAGSMAELLSTALSSAVELHLEIDPGPLPVHADVVQLEQVLMNLVLNAADAVGDAPGTVTVRTCLRDLTEESLSGWLGGEQGPGPYACLEVEDTGAGMDEAIRARIFEPFFTTKREGHGLGLSAALGLVQGHRGAIEVRSEPGRGALIRVALPADLAAQAFPTRPRRPLVLVTDAGGSRALGVALRDTDFETLEASDAAQAMDLWTRHGEEIDAVVVDARAPAIAAGRLARAFRESNPELPILRILAANEASGAEDASPGATLHAPFTTEEFRARLESLLQKRDAPA
jgi:PAS domain S-box-containing protein